MPGRICNPLSINLVQACLRWILNKWFALDIGIPRCCTNVSRRNAIWVQARISDRFRLVQPHTRYNSCIEIGRVRGLGFAPPALPCFPLALAPHGGQSGPKVNLTSRVIHVSQANAAACRRALGTNHKFFRWIDNGDTMGHLHCAIDTIGFHNSHEFMDMIH